MAASSRTSKVVVLVILVILIVAGALYYYRYSNPVSQTTQRVSVRFAEPSPVFDISSAAEVAATSFGFYQNEGLNVTWPVMVTGSPNAVKALTAGQVEFAESGPGAAIGAISAGAPVKIISACGAGTDYVIVANTKIKSAADLKGAAWGIESIGGSSYNLAVEYLRGIGMSSKDVNFVVVGFQSSRVQALIAGKIDLTAITIDNSLQLLNYPNIKVYADSSEVGEYAPEPINMIVTTQTMIISHPDIVTKVIRGYLQANRALAKDETLFDSVMQRIAPRVFNGTQLHYLYNNFKFYWAVNGGMSVSKVQKFIDNYYTIVNPSATKLSSQDLFDYTFVKQALNSIGTANASWDPIDYPLSIQALVQEPLTIEIGPSLIR